MSERVDPQLLAKRDRLIERFTALQLDLGGAYYEMAIRDHIRPEVLLRKAAELQRVDAELREVQEVLRTGQRGGGTCSSCGALHGDTASFCWQCGASLQPACAATAAPSA